MEGDFYSHSPFYFEGFQPSTIFLPKADFQRKITNFAVRLYYQLSYNYSLQYNMLLINALGIL
jgi:hypothetical protein